MPTNPKLTEAEMKQLAQDIKDDKVFTSGHVPLEAEIHENQVFMDFLWLGVTKQAAIKKKGGIGMIYQYRDQALKGQTVAGLPRFNTSFWLTPKQAFQLHTHLFGWNTSNTKCHS